MKLVHQSYKIIEQETYTPKLSNVGVSKLFELKENMLKHVEYVARTCYHSRDKITEGSANKMVDGLIKSGHYSALEHGTVYLKDYQPRKAWNSSVLYDHYWKNPYSKVVEVLDIAHYNDGEEYELGKYIYVTTNYRVIVENDWMDDLQFMCNPEEHHIKRVTIDFITSRNIANEFVRHRKFSWMQESTRYCNYTSDKHDNSLTFIIPSWVDLYEGDYSYWDGDWCDLSEMKLMKLDEHDEMDYLLHTYEYIATTYRILINKGWKPQQAALCLPLGLKTELIMTGFVDDFKHFFNLRSDTAETGTPHPMASELATPLRDEFIKRGWIK